MPLPRTIHYCWFGGDEKNELTRRCIESWKRFAPDCEIVEWNEQSFDYSHNAYARQAYEAKRWSFVSDYARLVILYENGGIYFDTDVELIRPIDKLFEGGGFIGFEQADRLGRFFVNTGGGCGAVRRDPVVAAMKARYDDISFCLADGSENLQPCPLYNTEAMREFGLRCDNTMQQIGAITVYPYDYFCPVSWRTHKSTITPNTYSIHHFDASWLSTQEKKKRRRERLLDEIVHLPNTAAQRLLGKEQYDRLKARIKGQND